VRDEMPVTFNINDGIVTEMQQWIQATYVMLA
jgi:hypothetical protein